MGLGVRLFAICAPAVSTTRSVYLESQKELDSVLSPARLASMNMLDIFGMN